MRLAPTGAAGCLGIDPIGPGASLLAAVEVSRRVVESGSALRTFRAGGATVADAGASEAQEIGFLLASATSCLRALCESGLTVAQAARQIELEVTADVDIFLTTAKLRALRHGWASILRASGADPAGAIHVSAVSSHRTLTVVDPWVNMLRGTAACLGAVLGGADTVTIAPFDGVDSLPGELGRRIARNTQLILQSEAAIGRVQDPAAGSWYVESLTDELAEKGWQIFQRIEAAGGPADALPALAQEIGQVAKQRDAAIARRERPITGVSEFPLLGEQRPDRTPVPQHREGPLPRRRLAAPFEDLRLAGEQRRREDLPREPGTSRRAHRQVHIRRQPVRRRRRSLGGRVRGRQLRPAGFRRVRRGHCVPLLQRHGLRRAGGSRCCGPARRRRPAHLPGGQGRRARR